jgi:hypothetical protein
MQTTSKLSLHKNSLKELRTKSEIKAGMIKATKVSNCPSACLNQGC